MPLISARIVSLIQPDAIAAAANAGPDQSILCAAVVQLNGEITGDDPENHTFEWEQTAGTPITLVNANTLTPTFINPQVSDIEITLYVDRNTPYEDSDTVEISRAPQSKFTGMGGTIGTTNTPGFATAQSNVTGFNDELIQDQMSVTGWVFNDPPTPRYSLIYKAEDMEYMRENLTGQYILMNDIDLSGYQNWNPIGSVERPFSGELQGNGYSIDGLSITNTPLAQGATFADEAFSDVVLIAEFEGANGESTTYTAETGQSFVFNNGVTTAELDIGQSRVGSSSLQYVSSLSRSAYFPHNTNLNLGTNNFCIETSVRMRDFSSNGSYTFISKWNFDTNNRSYLLSWDKTNLKWASSTDGTSGTGVNQISYPWSPSENVWYDLAVTYDGTTIRMYIDGIRVAETVASPSYFAGNANLGIGGYADANAADEFEGWIDHTRITIGSARYTGPSYTVINEAFPTESLTKPAGLFSVIGNGALIEKVGITNASIAGVTDAEYKGILAGSAQGLGTDDGGPVTIRDVYVSGTLASGGGNAGGLIGHTGTNVSSTFENTLADVNVTEANTDPLYPQVQFLASFDGADLQQTYTEQSQNALVATFQTGSSRIRTTEFYSSPSSYNNNSGTARLEFPNDAALQLGSSDFTIEFFVNFVGFADPGTNFIAGHYGTAGNRPWSILVTGGSDFILRLNGATVATFTPTNNTLATDTWYHIVIERSGEDWHFGLSGYREQSGIGGLVGAMQTADDVLTWGGNFNSGAISFLNGYIDDARITVGSARYGLASNETYDIPETPFATSTVSASVAGWAGNFQTEGVYNDNYWNTSKIDQGTGTGGDTPIAGEVDGLSSSALKTQSNYTNWDFDAIWQMPELKDNIGPAELQRDSRGRVKTEYECDDNWMISWIRPSMPTSIAPQYIYKGAIIEEWNDATGNWAYPRWIPYERHGAWMTPGVAHRVTAVWDKYLTASPKRNPESGTKTEIRVVVDRKFVSKGTSGYYGPSVAGSFTTIMSGTKGAAKVPNITISNPRFISLTENDPITVGGGSAGAPTNFYIFRITASQQAEETSGTVGNNGTSGTQLNLNILRVNGASIGD